MKNIFKIIFIILGMGLLQLSYAANSPIGYWRTIDDATGKPKGIVQIWSSADNVLHGRILKIWPRPGADQNELCTACQGDKHNQRIVGMVILENLKPNEKNPNEWSGGQILDPKNGKTYNCNIQLSNDGAQLKVRGYIGLPLFGRSQTWLKAESPTG